MVIVVVVGIKFEFVSNAGTTKTKRVELVVRRSVAWLVVVVIGLVAAVAILVKVSAITIELIVILAVFR